MRCTITTHDPSLTIIYPLEKVLDYFGEDYLEEYGIEVPDELVNEFLDNYNKLLEIQDKIDRFMDSVKGDNKNGISNNS